MVRYTNPVSIRSIQSRIMFTPRRKCKMPPGRRSNNVLLDAFSDMYFKTSIGCPLTLRYSLSLLSLSFAMLLILLLLHSCCIWCCVFLLLLQSAAFCDSVGTDFSSAAGAAGEGAVLFCAAVVGAVPAVTDGPADVSVL